MNGRTLNAIMLLVGMMGIGSLAIDQAQLVDLPAWARIVALVLSIGMLLWRKLPDEDSDGTPDVLEGFWPWLRSRLPWLMLVFALSMPACSGAMDQSVKWTGLSMDVDVQPDSVKGELAAGFAFWGVPVTLSVNYTSTMIGGCVTVAENPPFCYKRPVGE